MSNRQTLISELQTVMAGLERLVEFLNQTAGVQTQQRSGSQRVAEATSFINDEVSGLDRIDRADVRRIRQRLENVIEGLEGDVGTLESLIDALRVVLHRLYFVEATLS